MTARTSILRSRRLKTTSSSASARRTAPAHRGDGAVHGPERHPSGLLHQSGERERTALPHTAGKEAEGTPEEMGARTRRMTAFWKRRPGHI